MPFLKVYKVEEVKPTIVIEAASASATATTTTSTTTKDATSSGDTSSTKPTP